MNCNNCKAEMTLQTNNHCHKVGFIIYWCQACGTVFRRDHNDLTATGDQWLTPKETKPKENEPPELAWIDKYSVNCYFCNTLFDESEGANADAWNGNQGGSICPQCIKAKDAEIDAQAARASNEAEWNEGRQ